ncbi:hypothetical protein BDZ89DRAFT_1058333 [Hymenopellis radicata]|nr:hypothetical protein BDZ89DRAFT_1058333 [Hymenopellis radicata]
MAVADVEKGFGSIASSDCLALSLAVPMFAVVAGGVGCLVGGAIACGHRILQDGYVNDPRFSAPILSSFVVGIVGAMVILIPCSICCIFIGMMGGSARSCLQPALLTVCTLFNCVFSSVPLSAAAGAVGAAILRHRSDMVVLDPGWAAVCGLLGSAVISTASAILGWFIISCCLCCGARSLDD